MQLNKTEMMALDWLKQEKGYQDKDIIKNTKTPDFICLDGQRYEVKFLYGKRIIFYSTQIAQLKDDDIILVFNRTEFITEFAWKDKDKIAIKIKIENRDGIKNLKISEEAHQLLCDMGKKGETFDDIIKRIFAKDKVEG